MFQQQKLNFMLLNTLLIRIIKNLYTIINNILNKNFFIDIYLNNSKIF
jgi:hypothetical protein